MSHQQCLIFCRKARPKYKVRWVVHKAININFTPILSIHDCFGTHPNNLEKLEHIVKLEFISLYINNEFLTKFHNLIIESIKNNNYIIEKDENGNEYYQEVSKRKKIKKILIPKLPDLGKLDLTKIIDSKYMIT